MGKYFNYTYDDFIKSGDKLPKGNAKQTGFEVWRDNKAKKESIKMLIEIGVLNKNKRHTPFGKKVLQQLNAIQQDKEKK